ncbi:MAG: fructose-6-phosphate aldolase [Rickettsiales endosymbiont of Dermacentor nuttalli]
MKFFIDTANIDEIKELANIGLIDGVTTNPSLIVKTGRQFLEAIKEICHIIDGPVSAEVIATDYMQMVAEGKKLNKIARNVVVKLPLTIDGLKACKILTSEDIMVNITLCFSASQAILAAKAGATFVSPFVGRLDDISQDGLELIADICNIYNQYTDFNTQVLVASVRNPLHIVKSAKLGAHVATIPPSVIRQLVYHNLTDKGLEAFLTDWHKTNQKIL